MRASSDSPALPPGHHLCCFCGDKLFPVSLSLLSIVNPLLQPDFLLILPTCLMLPLPVCSPVLLLGRTFSFSSLPLNFLLQDFAQVLHPLWNLSSVFLHQKSLTLWVPLPCLPPNSGNNLQSWFIIFPGLQGGSCQHSASGMWVPEWGVGRGKEITRGIPLCRNLRSLKKNSLGQKSSCYSLWSLKQALRIGERPSSVQQAPIGWMPTRQGVFGESAHSILPTGLRSTGLRSE